MLLGLDESGLCLSGCRPEMQIHPLLRSLEERVSPPCYVNRYKQPLDILLPSVSSLTLIVPTWLFSNQMRKLIGMYLSPLVWNMVRPFLLRGNLLCAYNSAVSQNFGHFHKPACGSVKPFHSRNSNARCGEICRARLKMWHLPDLFLFLVVQERSACEPVFDGERS